MSRIPLQAVVATWDAFQSSTKELRAPVLAAFAKEQPHVYRFLAERDREFFRGKRDAGMLCWLGFFCWLVFKNSSGGRVPLIPLETLVSLEREQLAKRVAFDEDSEFNVQERVTSELLAHPQRDLYGFVFSRTVLKEDEPNLVDAPVKEAGWLLDVVVRALDSAVA